MTTYAYRAGDAVNWDVSGTTTYGFLDEDIPPRPPAAYRARVIGLDRAIWLVDLEKLRPTQ